MIRKILFGFGTVIKNHLLHLKGYIGESEIIIPKKGSLEEKILQEFKKEFPSNYPYLPESYCLSKVVGLTKKQLLLKNKLSRKYTKEKCYFCNQTYEFYRFVAKIIKRRKSDKISFESKRFLVDILSCQPIGLICRTCKAAKYFKIYYAANV